MRRSTPEHRLTDYVQTKTAGAGELTRSQLLLWTGQRLSPGSSLYNMVLTFEVHGALDAARFRRAFEGLVAGEESLRTCFFEAEGRPGRRVEADAAGELELATAPPDTDPVRWARAWSQQRALRPIDPSVRPYDAALLTLEPERHIWYFAQHHLIADAWSTGLCLERLGQHYASLASGDAPPAPGPAFEDYVRFEAGRSSTAAHGRAAEYWERLAAEPSQPTHFYGSTAPTSSTRTERVTVELDEGMTARIRSLAASPELGGLTAQMGSFSIFATALLALMDRVAGGGEDLRLLAPVHNRTSRAFKQTIGLLMEVLPLRVRIAEGETFRSLLRKTLDSHRSLLVHALPGSSTAEATRSADVLLNYIPNTFGDLAGMPVRAEWLHAGQGDPAHRLRLQVHDFEDAGRFVLHFDFHCDAFGVKERKAAIRHYQAFLEALLTGPDEPIDAVELLRPAERDAALAAASGARTSWSHSDVRSLLRERFCAASSADQVALRAPGIEWSYAELAARAERLAQELRQRGAEPGRVVALVLPRSAEFVLSVLAVLETGAAFLPIEPDLPARRIDQLLAASGTRVVLAPGARFAGLPPELRALALDPAPFAEAPESPEAERAAKDGPPREAASPSSERPAYIIYTSGSTGTPKGVEVSSASLAGYLQWAASEYAPDGPRDFPLFSSVSVDLTITSLFVPLLTGGAIRVYPAEDSGHDLSVVRVFADDAVDVVKLTPAHLSLVLGHDDLRLSRIRTLIVGGEDFPQPLARRAQDALGAGGVIYNEYGPTEATVACVVHRFDMDRDAGASVPIGKPIPGARAYLLDAHMRPVPAGVLGELWLGGAGLATGYRRDAEATSERFLASPFEPGERLYRSGDLARIDPAEGALVYAGRGDGQVKIRGARVELGEVQTCLDGHPGVREGLVVAAPPASAAGAVREIATDQAWSDLRYCVLCGLASNHPDADLDDHQVCGVCREYAEYADHAERYFQTEDELRALFAQRSGGSGDYDCLMLLSGGKDSTYALYQLARMGLRVLVFSLDNGYISDSAKANIQRVVDDLGLELVFGQTPSMNAIFVDSLRRFSNVCQGCFKTIYTLATDLAKARGIPYVVTGLSRGQIFETRLAGFFRSGVTDPDEIDAMVLEGRKAYHRVDDTVSRQLDVSLFQDDAIFDEVQFVDFYRYHHVPLDEVLRFIRQEAAWERPADTGRSTNCLINDAGIFVHKRERGYHNYALPYSWDVRLGHKTRDECLAELDDEIDEPRIQRILQEIGLSADQEREPTGDQRLVAYYLASDADVYPGDPVTGSELRAYLGERLPAFMVPAAYVALDSWPLAASGKIDHRALPAPEAARQAQTGAQRVAPRNELEATLAELWSEVLGIDRPGVHENYVELGGDSIQSIQIVSRARARGLRIEPKQIFAHPTIGDLAAALERSQGQVPGAGPQAPQAGPRPFLPTQAWFHGRAGQFAASFAQTLVLDWNGALEPERLRAALRTVVQRHAALRLRFWPSEAGWQQELQASAPDPEVLVRPSSSAADRSALERELSATLDPARAQLVAAATIGGPGASAQLVLAVHHLAIDAVSWGPLLEDLESAYGTGGEAGDETAQGPSFLQWVDGLRGLVPDAAKALPFWLEQVEPVPALPVDGGGGRTPGAAPGPRTSDWSTTVSLSPEDTSALNDLVRGDRRLRAPDALAACFAQALAQWSGPGSAVRLDVEAHGRDALDGNAAGAPSDVARMVGWLACLFPLRIVTSDALQDTLRSVLDTVERMPHGGASFGILRDWVTDAGCAPLRDAPDGEVLFNYLGQADAFASGLRQARVAEPLGVHWDPEAPRTHLLELAAYQSNGRLHLVFGASADHHDQATVEGLAAATVAELRQLLATGRERAPGDFPEANLGQGELDDILREFED